MRVHAPQIAQMLTAIANGEVPGPGCALEGPAHPCGSVSLGTRYAVIRGWHLGSNGFEARRLVMRPFTAKSPADALDQIRNGLVAALYGAWETV